MKNDEVRSCCSSVSGAWWQRWQGASGRQAIMRHDGAVAAGLGRGWAANGQRCGRRSTTRRPPAWRRQERRRRRLTWVWRQRPALEKNAAHMWLLTSLLPPLC